MDQKKFLGAGELDRENVAVPPVLDKPVQILGFRFRVQGLGFRV